MKIIAIITCMILTLAYGFGVTKFTLRDNEFLAKIFMNLWLMLQIIIIVWG